MRRLIAAFAIVVLIALALTLLWRVYVHHIRTAPYEKDEPVVVELQKFRAA